MTSYADVQSESQSTLQACILVRVEVLLERVGTSRMPPARKAVKPNAGPLLRESRTLSRSMRWGALDACVVVL